MLIPLSYLRQGYCLAVQFECVAVGHLVALQLSMD
jgi:hypothetical protein